MPGTVYMGGRYIPVPDRTCPRCGQLTRYIADGDIMVHAGPGETRRGDAAFACRTAKRA